MLCVPPTVAIDFPSLTSIGLLPPLVVSVSTNVHFVSVGGPSLVCCVCWTVRLINLLSFLVQPSSSSFPPVVLDGPPTNVSLMPLVLESLLFFCLTIVIDYSITNLSSLSTTSFLVVGFPTRPWVVQGWATATNSTIHSLLSCSTIQQSVIPFVTTLDSFPVTICLSTVDSFPSARSTGPCWWLTLLWATT